MSTYEKTEDGRCPEPNGSPAAVARHNQIMRELGHHNYLEGLEAFEFRKSYIPSHIDDEVASRVMWYLAHRGYLTPEYFDWETKTVIA